MLRAMRNAEGTVTDMGLRKLLSIICAAAVVVSSAGVFVVVTRDQGIGPAEIEKRLAWVDDCLSSPDQVVSGLTGKQYNNQVDGRALCAADSLGNVAGMEETTALIDGLIEQAKQNEEVRLACHNILHEVGRQAWSRSGEGSLVLGYETCGMGYYHGAMTTALDTDGQKTNLKYLLEFCRRLADVPQNGSLTRPSDSGEGFYDQAKNSLCMHGIGHALAGISSTIESGAEICTDVVVNSKASDPNVCFSGFLNEYLFLKPTNGEDPMEAVGPCSTSGVTDAFVKQCVKYMLANNSISSAKAREFCITQTDEWVYRGCWAAVGWVGGIKELLVGENEEKGKALVKDPAAFTRYAEALCAGDQTTECADNLLSEVSQVVLDFPTMERICENYSTRKMQKKCMANIRDLISVQGFGTGQDEGGSSAP